MKLLSVFRKVFARKPARKELIRVVVVGNCQARPIANLLTNMCKQVEITKIAIVHLLSSEDKDEYLPYFDHADHIICQLVSDDYPCEFVSTKFLEGLYPEKLVKIVNLFTFKDTPYLKNLPAKFRSPISPFGDYHFAAVWDAWNAGLSEQEAADKLHEEYCNSLKKIDYHDQELASREAYADVKIVEYIEAAKERLFHTFNHPNNLLLAEYTNRIVSRLGLEKVRVAVPDKEFLNQFIPFCKQSSDRGYLHKITVKGVVELVDTFDLVKRFYLYYSAAKLEENYAAQKVRTQIPNFIFQYWDKDVPPNFIQELMDTWQTKNPDFEYRLFNRRDAQDFIQKEYGDGILALFNKAALPAMQSDIFRVAYCLRKGGIYVDAATRCNHSIGDLLTSNIPLTVMRKWHGGIWNGLVVAHAGARVMESIWLEICANLEGEVGDNVWAATGPGLFNSACQKSDEVRVIDQKQLKVYFDLINDLPHKGDAHWSKQQKSVSIYGGVAE